MRNYIQLTEMLGSYTADTGSFEMKAVLAALSPEEKSLDLVFEGYLQHLYWSLSRKRWPLSQKKMSIVQTYFCKENATLNLAYEIVDSSKRTAKVAPGQLKKELAILDEKLRNAGKARMDMVYDPVGKRIVAEAFVSSVASTWNTGIQMLADKINTLGNSTM